MISKNQKNLIQQRDILFVDLDPVVGHEQAKKRPCLVLSPNKFNATKSDLVVILPITSTFRDIMTFVTIEPTKSGLSKTSYVITDQIRSVSKQRICGTVIGQLDQFTFQKIQHIVKMLLDLD